eukprot:gene10888-biopygen10914
MVCFVISPQLSPVSTAKTVKNAAPRFSNPHRSPGSSHSKSCTPTTEYTKRKRMTMTPRYPTLTIASEICSSSRLSFFHRFASRKSRARRNPRSAVRLVVLADGSETCVTISGKLATTRMKSNTLYLSDM